MKHNGNNKDSMKKQIRQILEEAAITCEDFEETTDKILALFGVVGQSGQFICGAERVHGEERCDKQCGICLEEYGTSK